MKDYLFIKDRSGEWHKVPYISSSNIYYNVLIPAFKDLDATCFVGFGSGSFSVVVYPIVQIYTGEKYGIKVGYAIGKEII